MLKRKKIFVDQTNFYYAGMLVTVTVEECSFADMTSFEHILRHDFIVTDGDGVELEHLNCAWTMPPQDMLNDFRVQSLKKLFRVSKTYTKEDLIERKRRKIEEIRTAANMFECPI